MKPVGSDRGRQKWLWAVALLGVLAVAGALAVRGLSARNSRRNAEAVRALLAARRFDEASRRLDAWAAAAPRDGQVDYDRAMLEVMRDRPAEALEALRRAVEHEYPKESVGVLHAIILARAGKFREAEPRLRPAFDQKAEPAAEIAEGLARVYLGTFRLGEAAQALERWMAVAPRDPRPHLWRNQIDERVAGDDTAVVRNYRAALERDPNLDDARLGLAQLLLKGHRTVESDREFSAYLKRNPKSVDGHNGAGQIALLKGDLATATRHFARALEGDPKNPVALRELALVDLRAGRYAEARDRLRVAVESSPFDPEVRYNYARALKLAGDEAQAAAEALATERLRKEQQKIADLRAALVERPNDADLRSEAAKWLIEHGHEKEGLEWTELILSQTPGHAPTCRLLADYYARKGNAGLANYYRITASPLPAIPPR
jgi:Flp pilus assembly protein TadD